MRRVELDRPQVDVEIQSEPETQDHRAFDQAGFDVGVADRPQQHRIQRAPLVDHAVGHQVAGLQIVLAAVRVLHQLVREAGRLAGRVEHLERLPGDLGTDPVTRKDADRISAHEMPRSLVVRGA